MTLTHVWHVFGTMNVGGAELRTLDLADALSDHGVAFHYVTLSGAAGSLDGRIAEAGGEVHPMPLGWSFPWRFYRSLRRHRPEVVDSHVATFSGLLVFLAWCARVPVRIAHFRSDGDGRVDTFRRRAQRRIMVYLIGRFATHIVGVSPSSLKDGYRPDWAKDPRARVIPNGLPAWPAQPDSMVWNSFSLPDADVWLMHVGRPSPEKNRPMTVRVLAALLARGVDARLALVGGDGADKAQMLHVLDDTGIGSRVHELGQRQGVRDLMSHANVLLLTSDREGLPGVVLEALSVGVPVVSTALPGAEFIGGEVGGVTLVDSRDPEDWADAVFAVTTGGESPERARLADAFSRGPFTLESAATAHMEIYR